MKKIIDLVDYISITDSVDVKVYIFGCVEEFQGEFGKIPLHMANSLIKEIFVENNKLNIIGEVS